MRDNEDITTLLASPFCIAVAPKSAVYCDEEDVQCELTVRRLALRVSCYIIKPYRISMRACLESLKDMGNELFQTPFYHVRKVPTGKSLDK